MSPPSRRSTIAVLLAASLVAGALVVGGVAGQTATEPNETATPTETATGATPPETPTEAGTPAANETETPTNETPTDATVDQDVAFHRVAHVSPVAPPVDVFVDGERVLADVSFGEVSDYQTLPAGDHAVRIATAGENATVFVGNVTLEPRSATTLFAAGEVGENATEPFAPVLFEDDPLQPADDEAAVSVSHMSPDAPAVDVTADDGSVVLADDVSFREATQYVTVPAGDHTVEIRRATETDDGPVVATTNVSLEGGTAYSAIAIGYVNDSAEGEAFDVRLVQDASKTVHLPADDGGDAGANETATPAPATETPEVETITEPAGEGTPEVGVNETETPTEVVEG